MANLVDVPVIDWDEAMQQCGDDEEFLIELLGDLRDETDSQMAKMEEIVQNPTDDPFLGFLRAAHVIKGAASNLMCEQLRQTAMALETVAGAPPPKETYIPTPKAMVTAAKGYDSTPKGSDTTPKGLDKPVGQAPVGQVPVGRVPVGQVPVGQVPVGQVPIGQVPIGQVPVGQAPVGQAPVGQAPVGQAPVVEAMVVEAPVVEAESLKMTLVKQKYEDLKVAVSNYHEYLAEIDV